MSEDRIRRIDAVLRSAFNPSELSIRDDSHLHHGHAGARDGRGHFHVSLRSEHFRNLPLLARHRAVYAALGTLMETDIHALSMDLQPPPSGHT